MLEIEFIKWDWIIIYIDIFFHSWFVDVVVNYALLLTLHQFILHSVLLKTEMMLIASVKLGIIHLGHFRWYSHSHHHHHIADAVVVVSNDLYKIAITAINQKWHWSNSLLICLALFLHSCLSGTWYPSTTWWILVFSFCGVSCFFRMQAHSYTSYQSIHHWIHLIQMVHLVHSFWLMLLLMFLIVSLSFFFYY